MSCLLFGIPLDELICTTDDCYLTFTNADGDILGSFPLCGAAIRSFGDTFQLCTSNGTLNMSVADLEGLGKSLADLDAIIKACKNGQPVEEVEDELCAALVQDFCAFGADRVLTKKEIIDFAVSKGLTYSDGTPVTSSAVIHKINIGIKLHDVPASDDMTGDFTTTNCEVDITSDGGTVTKTGGGNHTYTGQVVGEDLKESSFEEIIIKEGSCVEISAGIIEVS